MKSPKTIPSTPERLFGVVSTPEIPPVTDTEMAPVAGNEDPSPWAFFLLNLGVMVVGIILMFKVSEYYTRTSDKGRIAALPNIDATQKPVRENQR